MRAVIEWTLRQRRWYTTWWTFGVSAFVAIEIAFYPSFKNQFAQLNQTIDKLPSGVKGFLGDSGNYFSAQTYLNSRVFYLVVPLLLAILMIGLGSALLAREERNGTIELLLSRPVSRSRLLLSKALSGLLISGIVTLVSLIICILLSQAVGLPNSVKEITGAMLLTYLLCLIFGSFAFMLTAIGGHVRSSAVGLTTFFFITTYVLTGLEGTASWLHTPSKLLPYHYFHPQQMLDGHFAWGTVISYSLVSLAFGVIAWLAFRRRDIA
jgi:ABC-2 type transport system permease protein